MTALKSNHWIVVLLFLFALLFRLYLFFAIGYTTDDALITFRYAENLSEGKGFVYNPGEKILGTTTPLLTFLLALSLKLGISTFAAVFIISNIADFFTAWTLLRMFQYLSVPFNWLPSFIFLFNPESLQWSLSGMETELSIALMFAAFLLASREQWQAAFLAAGFAFLNRVDGVAVIAALIVSYMLRYRKFPLMPLLIAIVPILPWIIFSSWYFGSLIPNSATAKAALSSEVSYASAIQILVRGFLHLYTLGAPFLVLAVVGTLAIIKNKKEYLPIPVWTWGYALSYTLAAGPMHPWYFAPFYAGYLPLIYLGFLEVVRSYKILQVRALINGVCVAVIILVLYTSYVRTRELKEAQAHLNSINKAVGVWVEQNSEKESVLAVKDIGYIGYYSRRRILDLGGLVSPQTIPYRQKGDFLGPIRRFHPDYFAFSEGQMNKMRLRDSDLMQTYKAVKIISNEYGSYTIFKEVLNRK